MPQENPGQTPFIDVSDCICGTPARVLHTLRDGKMKFYVSCTGCGRTGSVNRSATKAVLGWNDRQRLNAENVKVEETGLPDRGEAPSGNSPALSDKGPRG